MEQCCAQLWLSSSLAACLAYMSWTPPLTGQGSHQRRRGLTGSELQHSLLPFGRGNLQCCSPGTCTLRLISHLEKLCSCVGRVWLKRAVKGSEARRCCSLALLQHKMTSSRQALQQSKHRAVIQFSPGQVSRHHLLIIHITSWM